MITDFNVTWFNQKLEEQRLSKRGLAKLMDLDPAAVSLMLRGLRKMSVTEAGEIASLLRVTVDEVLRHAGVNVSAATGGASTPIIGWMNADKEVSFERPAGPGVCESPPGGFDDVVAIRTQAPGQPFDGWLIYYRPIDGISLEALGRLCVVKLQPDGPTYILPVSRGYEVGKYNLGGWNTPVIPNVGLISASPVIWMKQ